jgi:pimeloyl-ACP methyl ester carboxylesterase
MATLEIRGDGDRSWVFVHGTPSDRRVFHDLAERAPADAAVVLVDLPDHGEAPDQPTTSLAPFEQAVREAVAAAPGRVTVVGHSFGAWLVAATSSAMPERVAQFVAISGLSCFVVEDIAARQALVDGLESGEIGPDDVREALLGMFLGDERNADTDAKVAPMFTLSRERWLRVGRRVIATGDRPPVFFERPATIIHGTADAGVPLARAEDLARRSGTDVVTIDTTSHMLPITHPDELAAILFRP